MKKSDTEEVRK